MELKKEALFTICLLLTILLSFFEIEDAKNFKKYFGCQLFLTKMNLMWCIITCYSIVICFFLNLRHNKHILWHSVTVENTKKQNLAFLVTVKNVFCNRLRPIRVVSIWGIRQILQFAHALCLALLCLLCSDRFM